MKLEFGVGRYGALLGTNSLARLTLIRNFTLLTPTSSIFPLQVQQRIRILYNFRAPYLQYLFCMRYARYLRRIRRMMARPRSPQNEGLAARTGWIGAIARFWEVMDSPLYTTHSLMEIQKTYAADYVGFSLLLTAYICVRSPSVFLNAELTLHSWLSLSNPSTECSSLTI